MSFRIGHGYDVHRLIPGRRLIIGGVEIPFALGLDGHSDADVLCHAITDAILGAAALGDIGRHFPDSDGRYKGADSLVLLSAAYNLARREGYKIGNIDATIIAQEPKMSPHIPQMRKNIAQKLACPESCISVKATTEEGLGLSGKGIAAHAVCLLEENPCFSAVLI
ncbi:MAG: 2-C-methyl-D-erythritol 2,4-cyclodiphosphate synthase [Oscillospiraceae bacterium]|jgi:2-C-methyl-D-erythritol 2,4-cyclodiphosphate synthase|nr:2-C-methyl-D-erythritol 2,4-cyclodiphosphate synthase [Oscillospiraceae bacterium]